MYIKKTHLLLLLCLVLSPGLSLAATRNCARTLTAKSVGSLKPVNQLPLPHWFKSRLDKHGLAELRNAYGPGGEELSFVLSHGRNKYLLNSGALGEHIQGLFLMQILRHYFPKAEVRVDRYVHSEPYGFTGNGEIPILIVDSFEGWENRPHFHMADLKMINPLGGSFDRVQLRDELGISQDVDIVSVYAKYMLEPFDFPQMEESGQVEAYLNIIANLPQKPHIVFFSQGGRSATKGDYEQHALGVLGYETHHLTRIKPGLLDPEKHHVVFNNLGGRIPYLHTLANTVIVKGPINFFEAIYAGTPLIYFNDMDSLGHYDARGFGMMETIAQETAGAHPVVSYEQMRIMFESQVSLTPPTSLPLDHTNERGETPLSKVLNQIQSLLPSRNM